MESIRPYIQQVDNVLWRIGYKNIFVGGIVGTAFLAYMLMPTSTDKKYYTHKFFKRTKPTRFVYDHPY